VGTNNNSSLQNPSHLFNSSANYNISLTVTTTTGCVSTLTPLRSITINPKPKVNFNMPTGVCQGLPVNFTDLSKIADSTMSAFTHSWNFGDPTSTTNTAFGTPLPNPSHLYSNGGVDSVRLIVTSNKGCIDSMVKAVGTTVIIPATPTYRINGVLRDSTTNYKRVFGNFNQPRSRLYCQ
jgi:PKD repeat protein